MKYSFSEPLNRNIMRHLRFQYPTFMLSTPQFEIDEEGQPGGSPPGSSRPSACSAAPTSRALYCATPSPTRASTMRRYPPGWIMCTPRS